jgi:serine/threonine protein kinase
VATGSEDALVAEARLLAQLDHPNLVRVHDLGFHENCPYVVLDYVPGRSLREVVRDQPLSAERAAEIVAKVARALAVVHARGITHGDLKPANILIDENGEPRLIDFGIARERSAWSANDETSEIAGTLLYMAPEQARGESARIGCRTDVYGLGACSLNCSPAAAAPHRFRAGAHRSCVSCDVELAAPADPAFPSRCSRLPAGRSETEDRQCSVESLADQIDGCESRSSRQRATCRAMLTPVAVSLVIGLSRCQTIQPQPHRVVANPAQAAAELVAICCVTTLV